MKIQNINTAITLKGIMSAKTFYKCLKSTSSFYGNIPKVTAFNITVENNKYLN